MRLALLAIVVVYTGVGGARAELVFSEATLDLRQVRAGQLFEHRIPLVNQGTAALEVVETKAGCGCVKAEVEPRVVPGGQKASLVLRINTLSASPGPHAWRVQVGYRQGGQLHEAVMIIHAHVFQELIVQPPTIIIYSASATRHELMMTDMRTKPLRILKLEPSSPHLKAAVVEEKQDQAGHLVRKIDLQVTEGFSPGRHDETVTIHTDDPLYRQLQVQVSVVKKARQRYSALPPSVSVVASASQPSPSRLVSIRDSQGQPVSIERVQADDPAIACQWSTGSNPVATVKIAVDSAKMLGNVLNGRVTVHLQSGEKLIIPVQCDAR
jgi:hypothetical protein